MEPWTAAPGPTAVAQAREVQHFRQRKSATRRITRYASASPDEDDACPPSAFVAESADNTLDLEDLRDDLLALDAEQRQTKQECDDLAAERDSLLSELDRARLRAMEQHVALARARDEACAQAAEKPAVCTSGSE